MTAGKPLVINSWTIFAHSLFLEQLETRLQKVENLRRKDPKGYTKKKAAKQLATISKLAFEIIPQDPTRTDYRQGATLGEGYKHWFRAKFFQQYRLFFRYHRESKIIIYAWVNDDNTKRAYGSSTDAHHVSTNTGCLFAILTFRLRVRDTLTRNSYISLYFSNG